MKTGAVIIAAGHKSTISRFQPMLPVGDSTVIRRIIITLKRAGIDPVVVITGQKADEVEKHIAGLRVICLRNQDYEQTQMYYSICMGLNYIEDLCDRVFILPAKFPMFLPDTIQRMMGSRAMAACPVYNGKRGHPVLVSKAAIPSLLVYHGERGLRGALRQPEINGQLEEIPVEDEGIIMAVESDEDCALGSLGREKLAVYPQVQLTLERNEGFFGPQAAQFLSLIDHTGSMQTACRQMHMSYTKGWKILKEAERQLGYPLLITQSGGAEGGFSQLTPKSKVFLDRYLRMERELRMEGERLYKKYFTGEEETELRQLLEQGEEAVLVTIIASSGSTPRGTGSRMLVRKDGSIEGTVGGGAVEYQAIQAALKAMEDKASFAKGFTLTRNQVADIGMVCGGNVVVYFQYIRPGDQVLTGFCGQVLDALSKDEDSWLILDITDETCWQMGLYSPSLGLSGIKGLGQLLEGELFGSNALQKEVDGRKFYIEPLVQAGTVYIFGGGHVAQELVPVLAHVGFRCVVMDDREAFANPQVFLQAERTVVGDMEHISDYVDIRSRDYVCVMTRGHQFDYYVQKQAMALHPYYIGIMGSRNKIRVVTDKLLADGFSLEEIQKCHMPIGTDIGAETPAEIAISIAGELIARRADRMGKKK